MTLNILSRWRQIVLLQLKPLWVSGGLRELLLQGRLLLAELELELRAVAIQCYKLFITMKGEWETEILSFAASSLR